MRPAMPRCPVLCEFQLLISPHLGQCRCHLRGKQEPKTPEWGSWGDWEALGAKIYWRREK